MRNNSLEAFESSLAKVLAEVDNVLEIEYGRMLPRHPQRPAMGKTANPQYDGLFSVAAKFSAGIGSFYGPGYTLELRASTLLPVSQELQKKWEQVMVEILRKRLPQVFPGRHLLVDLDRYGWKIHGDLSLGQNG